VDRSNSNLLALMFVELLVLAVLAYLALVAEVIEVMTMAYAVAGLSVVTTPLFVAVLRGREDHADDAA
jgi:hypothetical protein